VLTILVVAAATAVLAVLAISLVVAAATAVLAVLAISLAVTVAITITVSITAAAVLVVAARARLALWLSGRHGLGAERIGVRERARQRVRTSGEHLLGTQLGREINVAQLVVLRVGLVTAVALLADALGHLLGGHYDDLGALLGGLAALDRDWAACARGAVGQRHVGGEHIGRQVLDRWLVVVRQVARKRRVATEVVGVERLLLLALLAALGRVRLVLAAMVVMAVMLAVLRALGAPNVLAVSEVVVFLDHHGLDVDLRIEVEALGHRHLLLSARRHGVERVREERHQLVDHARLRAEQARDEPHHLEREARTLLHLEVHALRKDRQALLGDLERRLELASVVLSNVREDLEGVVHVDALNVTRQRRGVRLQQRLDDLDLVGRLRTKLANNVRRSIQHLTDTTNLGILANQLGIMQQSNLDTYNERERERDKSLDQRNERERERAPSAQSILIPYC